MDNKKPTENHSTTNTEVKMSADARRYTCFFSCMRSTTDDVYEEFVDVSGENDDWSCWMCRDKVLKFFRDANEKGFL